MFHVNQLNGFGGGGFSERIKFVGGAVGGSAGSGTGDRSITINTGLIGGISSSVAVGDLIVSAYCIASTADKTLGIEDSTAVAYTLISELYSNDSNDTNLRAAYKFSNGTGDDSTVFKGVNNLTDAFAMASFVFRGVDPTTPLDVSVTTATGINSVLASPPSITPITTGAYVVAIGAGAEQDDSGVFYTSSNLTGFQSGSGADGSASSTDAVIGIGFIPNWSTGVITPAQFGYSTTDNVGNSWAAITIALRPAL